MVRKEFTITERQLKVIREKAVELGISQNESLRRILDNVIDKED